MGIADTYLIAYNAICCLGWFGVWALSVGALIQGSSLAAVYETPNLGGLLAVVQSAAMLEILHALVKLVRSPVMVTAMQVSSRILALYAVNFSKDAQSQWGAALMMISWASVEVPRYAFYVAALLSGDATKGTPYPLFWLRYSLFAVLYPTGIIGELTVFMAASKDAQFTNPVLSFVYGKLLLAIYIVGSPLMVFNMVMNRKSAFKKRFAKPKPPPRGLCWPVDKKGERSSTETNKAIIAAALGAIDPAMKDEVMKCKGWRFKYVKYLRALVEAQCKSPEDALKSAQAGLDKAYELFEFVAPDGSGISFKQAMADKNTEKFYTASVKGELSAPTNKELVIPYKDGFLKGQEIKDQVKKWVDYGTIEPSAGEAIIKCVDNPAWLTDFKKRYFVLLGAGSAMGPLNVLLALGANVVAIDLDRPGIWKGLIARAKNSAGSITFPVKVNPDTLKGEDALCENAGCNLFTHTPLIRDWLVDLYPGKPFTVGSYAYMDGALHVQVSLAMDAISRDLTEKRPNTSLAYLCTPTDLHLIPEEAHKAADANLKEYSARPLCIFLGLLSSGKFLRSNVKKPVPGKGGDFFLANGISVAQGPNYALAKRMQHWRAIIARSKQGCTVSSNIAPSTSTVSVVHNRTFAWAYEGMPYFKPFEIFAPDTSKAVMLALLAFDLNDPKSVANPKTVTSNPNQLFSYGSFHGGLWRCAYEVDSIGESSVLIYFSRLARPYAFVAGAAGAALAAILLSQSS